MSMLFEFEFPAVRRLMSHVNANPAAPILNDLFDFSVLKPGGTLGDGEMAASEDVDVAKIPPRLVLVSDSGVYLLASTTPELRGDDGRTVVTYATGHGEHTSLGGDDFAETIPLSMIEAAIRKLGTATPRVLRLELSDTELSVSCA